jgi:3-oxoacyl-[acyl-carrier-protein] synthase II
MVKQMGKGRRVVVTGIGLICPTGIGTDNAWKGILGGRSGIGRVTLFDATSFPCKIAGEVPGFDPLGFVEKRDVKKTARFIQFALAATEFAVRNACLNMEAEPRDRVGVFMGSGVGGFEAIEREHAKLMSQGPGRVSPFFITAAIVNMAAGQISIRLGAAGPNLAPATACTTGAHAIGEAYRIIQYGDADVMICGGSEAAITPLAMAGFCAMRAVSVRNDQPALASRPWDRGRDGFVLGEGAGALVIEEREHALRRGAKPIAELIGYGRNSDAYHANAPLENGDGIRRVMELALADAAIPASDVGYLNAHATSTPLGDRAEAAAIRTAFGEHSHKLAVSSTKSMTGHLLGGAGSLEAGFAVLALRDQIAPPTINLVCPDTDYGLDFVPNTARPLSMRHAMTNSFGFGGGNASLIFRTSD